MKKTLVLLVLIATVMCNYSKAQIGIQAGVVGILGEAFTTDDGLDAAGGSMGYTFGLLYNHSVGDNFVFQPALNLVNKSWKDELDNGFEIVDTKVSVNYLEIPLQFLYTGGKSKGLVIGGGPSIMYSMSGKRTITVDGDEESSSKLSFGSEDDQEKPLTIALNLMAGYSFGSLFVNLNYSLGITNQPDDFIDRGNESHLALRVGYLLGKK
ncbi:MAG: outer membrane beta-barrel protein [Cyclobacteriaceae bacterium]